MTGTKVIGLGGGHPSLGRIAWRTFLRSTPFDALTFLIWNRGWHDRLSRTRVVQVRVSEPR